MKFQHYLFITFFFTLFAFNSCVENCLDDGSMFRIRLELESSKSGVFTVKYNSQNRKNLVVKSEVVNTEGSQFVEFCLEEEPLDFKVYVTESLENVDLKVMSVLLENDNRQMFIKQEMFHLYFKNTQGVQFNKKTNIYFFNPSKAGEQKPYIGSRKSLQKRLINRLNI
ncbi:hypothetical protein [Winogradskyella aquimaris]|uniref:Lipoprotein n=1 Tax=Winogradskyella aquimaris TaxID=864074 RepID=A0ABU5ELU7_9FLAO|nr:hypothetical protein [Winogradskyella aquimaris]MDY2586475.1 hypothetical protein [Winogradskyella aquimaris]